MGVFSKSGAAHAGLGRASSAAGVLWTAWTVIDTARTLSDSRSLSLQMTSLIIRKGPVCESDS